MIKAANLVVGLTVAPRLQSTVDITIQSLHKSGWDNIHVFAEPETKLPSDSLIKISRRKEQYGAWKNWFYGLKELYETYDQPWYMMVQDDVVFCRGTREYVSTLVRYPNDLCFFSLFTPKMYVGQDRWVKQDLGSQLWMAQTICLPRHIVPLLLSSNEVWKIAGTKNIDNRLGMFARLKKLGVYFHNPSLCQHIGETSTIWDNGVSASGRRAAVNYVGDDFDCMSLLTKKAA